MNIILIASTQITHLSSIAWISFEDFLRLINRLLLKKPYENVSCRKGTKKNCCVNLANLKLFIIIVNTIGESIQWEVPTGNGQKRIRLHCIGIENSTRHTSHMQKNTGKIPANTENKNSTKFYDSSSLYSVIKSLIKFLICLQ